MRRRALRGDSGQTAVDYAGILVLVVLIVLALIQVGLGARLVGIAGDAMRAVQQRGAGDSASTDDRDGEAQGGSDWIP